MRYFLALFFYLNAHAATQDPMCAKTLTTLRKGPGSQFPVSWTAARYMPFLRVEIKKGWFRVQDFEGEMHWAQAHDLSAAFHCVVVKAQVATLRLEPSSTALVADLKTVDRYTAFKKLDTKGEWIHVEDENGMQAWIHESNVWKPARVQSVTF